MTSLLFYLLEHDINGRLSICILGVRIDTQVEHSPENRLVKFAFAKVVEGGLTIGTLGVEIKLGVEVEWKHMRPAFEPA